MSYFLLATIYSLGKEYGHVRGYHSAGKGLEAPATDVNTSEAVCQGGF
jgi:hypothetical protein